jgi:hypothetical protein
MPKYHVRYVFSMVCETKGLTIEADSLDEAEQLAEQALEGQGVLATLDYKKFEALGGDTSVASWGVCDGTDHSYELSEVEEDEE